MLKKVVGITIVHAGDDIWDPNEPSKDMIQPTNSLDLEAKPGKCTSLNLVTKTVGTR